MSALINFRDFGGEATTAGGHVQRDRLYRGGRMVGLDDAAVAKLLRLDFALVLDLRYAEERQKDRSPWPDAMLERVLAHDGSEASDAPHLQIFAAAMAGHADIDDAYHAFYSALPFDRWYRPLFAEATRKLAATEGRVLIHCTAGKDRTGTYVALLLDLLGVPRAAVIADYMRSLNAPGFRRLREEVADRLGDTHAARPSEAQMDSLVGVKPSYLEAVFAAVEARCGSVGAYFDEAGVDEAMLGRLRANFLTD